jgi:hypothetical protein
VLVDAFLGIAEQLDHDSELTRLDALDLDALPALHDTGAHGREPVIPSHETGSRAA